LNREYVVRAYQPGDDRKIVELLDLVFGGWPKFDFGFSPLEHWKWKYQDNPLKLSQIAVGESDNRIISCEHSFPLRIKIGDKVCLAHHSGDLAVHPDFRRMAASEKMRELLVQMREKAGSSLVYFVTFNPILIESLSKFYRRFPYKVITFIRIHDIGLHLRKMPIEYASVKKYYFQLVKLMNRFRGTSQHYTPSSYNFQIREIAAFDNSINVFWEEIKNHYDFIIERSRDFLNWRYFDARGGDYLVKIAEKDSKILGYVVLRINKHQKDYPLGYVVDLLTLPNRLDVAHALVADAVDYFANNNINVIYCLVIKHHPYQTSLERNGFVTRREEAPFFYKESAKVEEPRKFKIDSPGRIHFAYGNFDAI